MPAQLLQFSCIMEVESHIPTFSKQGRLTDTNKNLVAKALTLFGELAKAIGPAWERSGRPVLQQATTFIADIKKQVCHNTPWFHQGCSGKMHGSCFKPMLNEQHTVWLSPHGRVIASAL